MKYTALMLIALMPCYGAAQTVTIPDKLAIPKKGLVVIRATAMDADDVRWWSHGDTIQVFPSDIVKVPPGVFMGFVSEDGVYRVSCIPAKAVMGKAVIGQVQTCEVTVGTPAPPVPAIVVVPNVVGQGAVAATQALLGVGLKTAYIGDVAQPVASQSPAAGVSVPSGSTVTLTMGVPVPPAPPAPIAGDGFKVLIVYETGAAGQIPYTQQLVIFDQGVRKYLDTHCVKGEDGKTPERRIWDSHVTGLENETKTWQDAFARKRSSSPWIVISNGKTGIEAPLPNNAADTLALLKKYGGD